MKETIYEWEAERYILRINKQTRKDRFQFKARKNTQNLFRFQIQLVQKSKLDGFDKKYDLQSLKVKYAEARAKYPNILLSDIINLPKNIVPEQSLGIVYRKMSKLQRLSKRIKKQVFDDEVILKWMLEIRSFIACLHQYQLWHGCINLNSIFLCDTNRQIYLSRFNLNKTSSIKELQEEDRVAVNKVYRELAKNLKLQNVQKRSSTIPYCYSFDGILEKSIEFKINKIVVIKLKQNYEQIEVRLQRNQSNEVYVVDENSQKELFNLGLNVVSLYICLWFSLCKKDNISIKQGSLKIKFTNQNKDFIISFSKKQPIKIDIFTSQLFQQSFDTLENDLEEIDLEEFTLQGSKLKQEQQNSRDLVTAQNQDKYPYNHVGCLKIRFIYNNHLYIIQGTGTLIRNRVVLTCAHNLYQIFQVEGKQIQYQANQTQITFQLKNSKTKATKYYFPQQYKLNFKTQQRNKYDFAVIYLNTEINMKTKIFMFQNFRELSNQVSIAGFSGKQQKSISKVILEKFDQIKGLIYHRSDTMKGKSGSPILLSYLGFYAIIGIHIASRGFNIKIAKYFDEGVVDYFRDRNKSEIEEINNSLLRYASLNPVVDDHFELKFQNLQKKLNVKSQTIRQYKQLYARTKWYLFWEPDVVLRKIGLQQTNKNYNRIVFLKFKSFTNDHLGRVQNEKRIELFTAAFFLGYHLFNLLIEMRFDSIYEGTLRGYSAKWGLLLKKIQANINITQEHKISWYQIFSQSLKLIKLIDLDEEMKAVLVILCEVALQTEKYDKMSGGRININYFILLVIRGYRMIQIFMEVFPELAYKMDEVVVVTEQIFGLVLEMSGSAEIKQIQMFLAAKSLMTEVIIRTANYIHRHCPKHSKLRELLEIVKPGYHDPEKPKEQLRMTFPNIIRLFFTIYKKLNYQIG